MFLHVVDTFKTVKMQLWAIADIHISYKSNREEFSKLKSRPEDGLILAGDGTLHSLTDLEYVLADWHSR